MNKCIMLKSLIIIGIFSIMIFGCTKKAVINIENQSNRDVEYLQIGLFGNYKTQKSIQLKAKERLDIELNLADNKTEEGDFFIKYKLQDDSLEKEKRFGFFEKSKVKKQQFEIKIYDDTLAIIQLK